MAEGLVNSSESKSWFRSRIIILLHFIQMFRHLFYRTPAYDKKFPSIEVYVRYFCEIVQVEKWGVFPTIATPRPLWGGGGGGVNIDQFGLVQMFFQFVLISLMLPFENEIFSHSNTLIDKGCDWWNLKRGLSWQDPWCLKPRRQRADFHCIRFSVAILSQTKVMWLVYNTL